MHLINAMAWTLVGLCMVQSAAGSDKFWITAFTCAGLNIAWEFCKKKEIPGSAVDLKNLPRNKDGWEVATEVKLDCWHSVIQSAGRCLLVRSRQKLPKRFTTSEPVAVSIDD